MTRLVCVCGRSAGYAPQSNARARGPYAYLAEIDLLQQLAAALDRASPAASPHRGIALFGASGTLRCRAG